MPLNAGVAGAFRQAQRFCGCQGTALKSPQQSTDLDGMPGDPIIIIIDGLFCLWLFW